jgi:hypothetical protein
MEGVEQQSRSLADVHSSVDISQLSFWRRMFAFAGPAYLVSVGYMDPGNWATDLEGGARFGYRLLWVLVMSNAMAILLQTLSARLGIVHGRDLAQACRETYPRSLSFALWVLSEIAIAACDLAEVLGAAIALNLLFHIPLLIGVILTAADTLLLLWFQSFGIRAIEAFILSLITVMAVCFCIEVFWAHPAAGALFNGLVPRLNRSSLYLAVTILGATVMPHNMYLHSALVQTRMIGRTDPAKRMACRFNLIGGGAERRHARQLRHPGAGGGGVFQARDHRHRDSAGARAAGSAAGRQHGGRAVRGRVAVLRAVFHAHRNHGGPGGDGRLPQHPRAALAAPPDHAHAGRGSSRTHHLFRGRQSHPRAATVEPGDFEHAVAIRHRAADSLHQRPRPHGLVRQCGVGALALLDHSRRGDRSQHVARLRFD